MKPGRRAALILLILMSVFLLLNTPLVWKWMYPIKFQQEIVTASNKYNVDPYLILAVIRSESSFKTDRVSKKGAVGLMQIMPDTAAWIVQQAGFKPKDNQYLYDPVMNIHIGTWYLNFLLERYEGDLVKVIAAYNAGPGKVSGWLSNEQWSGQREHIEDIPFGETRQYVQRVLYYHDRYKKVYGKDLQ
ncbi:lytic transglycosylase domain-containing protein [Brevibacillus centrosporus]|jgi:soluble lytic murein transglycosylase|uniref:Soluble lytic murein transglycosylase n=1 Tax=Brevibacillus centrosporus TaxID=54910 RepID=A0A1I3L621_9BACL|nr:lytic transglycosylase domain-containing protein [Brevibacillus centrosporus]MEC2130156.1 lytic transglycosylase domain-containing protein [Brevibacillus centrosporus]MED4907060.1 lytic transglycosylase domain-containing protein [Brevibacillus centrosporus]RNB66242.1 lytic transglycosylase domain-containing protein [Brevibacillus centrosporus]SFI80222.1 soluble lytic murein transglycosylase [Brevibacillus centrosporus]GED34568.1 transglycosylase [Brevibacillus centrosporus]